MSDSRGVQVFSTFNETLNDWNRVNVGRKELAFIARVTAIVMMRCSETVYAAHATRRAIQPLQSTGPALASGPGLIAVHNSAHIPRAIAAQSAVLMPTIQNNPFTFLGVCGGA